MSNDFFQPGRTYQRRRWQFQCLAVAPNPFNEEIRAVGFLYRPGEPATATALDPDDWAHGGWVGIGEGVPTLVFRASHDSIVMGLYTTAAEAQKHCEADERRSWGAGHTLAFDWIEDEEDGVAELVVTAGQNEESTTGYVVEALEVCSAYDPDADE